MRGVRGVSLALAGLFCCEAFADDGVTLQVSHSAAAGEVRLDWSGGQPTFDVYRATNPRTIVSPANKLGTTAGGVWLDVPPAGSIFYYRIVGPCVTPSAEACDGVDDDCDGFLDNGCPGACQDDGGCAAAESCDTATDHCVPDVANGQACGRDEQCLADHCSNGVCCVSGDCCTSAAQCAASGWELRCDDASTCQGSTGIPACTGSFQCAGVPVGDDSACAGMVSQTCGAYPSIVCTSAASQTANQAGLCAGSCAGDGGCDADAHCDVTGQCAADLDLGGLCGSGSQCQSGICVDGVCCGGACNGTCQACDLGASSGTCTLVPSLSDPDAECGGVSCVGFYHSWAGDVCRRKADATAAQTTCNGSGACQSTAQECTAQTTVGPAAVTCNALCQNPNLATCTGTTAGTCTNVNPGSQTCGFGVCAVTVPQCSNGAPQTCVPNSGAASPETCNNIDDNCDGTADNGSFADGLEPNNTCTSYSTLVTVGSDQTLTQNSRTLYASGDVDYYRINALETDSSCGCGAFSFDEDYDLRVTLTVPAGAGSYLFCTDQACGSVSDNCRNVDGGSSLTWTWNLDGACGPGESDSYSIYFRVSPGNSPGFECTPYTLSYTFDAGLCR